MGQDNAQQPASLGTATGPSMLEVEVLVETWDLPDSSNRMMAAVCDPTAAAAAAATSSGLAGAPRAGPGSSDARAPLRLAVHLARAAGAGAAACRSTRGERLGARIG